MGFPSGENCSSLITVLPLDASTTAAVNVSMGASGAICVSTEGADGPWELQEAARLHIVAPASSESISQVSPDKFSAGNAVSMTFTGADFSEMAYVGITSTADCANLVLTFALASGSGNQSAAIDVEFQAAGIYSVCYSTLGAAAGEHWALQAGVSVNIIAGARSGALAGVRVCNASLCTSGDDVRVPRGTEYIVTFQGLDFSGDTRVGFSQRLHPWFGRPDCSAGRVNEMSLASGAGSQSSSVGVTFAAAGTFHVCVSTKFGAEGSWFPQGEPGTAESAVYVTVVEPAGTYDLLRIRPARAVAGERVMMTLQGLHYSAFTRVAFVPRGTGCAARVMASEVTLNSSAPIAMTVPSAGGKYTICYTLVGQEEYVKQLGDGSEFWAIDPASSGDVVSLEATDYGVGPEAQLTVTRGEREIIVFSGAQFAPAEVEVGFEHESSENCSNVRGVVALADGIDGQSLAVVVTLPAAGSWSVCYRTSQEWFKQTDVFIEAIEPASPSSITSIDCEQLSSNLTECGEVRAGETLSLQFSGAVPSPRTYVAFTPTRDCSDRLAPIPLINSTNATTILDDYGTFSVCYSNTYHPLRSFDASWFLQRDVEAVQIRTVWDAVTGLTSGAAGGGNLTLAGAGFRTNSSYSCHLLAAGVSRASTPATVLSTTALTCAQPAWPHAAASVTLGLFEVDAGAGGARRLLAESLVAVAKAGAAPEPLVLVPQWTAFVPAFGDKLGGSTVTIQGFGFNDADVACVFTLGGVAVSANATLVSATRMTCVAPEWSTVLASSYNADVAGAVNVSVVASAHAILTAQTAAFTFRFINKPPAFDGSNVDDLSAFPAAGGNGARLFPFWAGAITKGKRATDGLVAVDEVDQAVAFHVTVFEPGYFSVLPTVSPDGNLTFTQSHGTVGRAYLLVTASDNGGTAYGGVDSSVSKRFSIRMREDGTSPIIQVSETLTVMENEGGAAGETHIVHFANPQDGLAAEGSKGADFLVEETTFDAEALAPDTFLQQPRISGDGTLVFETAVGFYGDTSVRYRVKTTGGVASEWSTVVIYVLQTNQAPSFSAPQIFSVLEDSGRTVAHRVAANISRGIYPEAAELGIYYTESPFRANEATQNVTFTVVLVAGDLSMFSEAPSLSRNGTLTLSVVAHRNGNATFRIILSDDGGVPNAFSRNTSLPALLTIVILPVNDPPSFALLANHTIQEHSAPYAESVPGFASDSMWRGRFTGPPDEATQGVTFHLEYHSGNATLFDSGPRVTAHGALEFVAGAFQWGEVVFRVFAVDDGGVTNGGFNTSSTLLLKITITPVDDPPTIGLPYTLFVWRSPWAAPPYNPAWMLTQETCCPFCPGPGCGTGQTCCHQLSPLGALASIPATARSSGGFAEIQALAFTVQHDNPALFAAAPRILPSGAVQLNLAGSTSGHARLHVRAVDAGWRSSEQDIDVFVLSGFVLVELWLPPASPVDEAGVRALLAAVAGTNVSHVVLRDSLAMAPAPSGPLRKHVEAEVLGLSIADLLSKAAALGNAGMYPAGSEVAVSVHSRSDDATGFALNSSFSVPENALVAPHGLRDLRVDGATFDQYGNQVVNFNVTVVRYKAPASVANWTFGSGSGFVFSSPPRVVAVCDPYCLTADLVLSSTDVHGIVELDITIFSDVDNSSSVTQRVMVTIEPV